MKKHQFFKKNLAFGILSAIAMLQAPLTMLGGSPGSANQTQDLSPIYTEKHLPFTVSVEQADFSLPFGFHSGAAGNIGNTWLFISGRTNGLHGFNNDDNNFPPDQQNSNVIVVDFDTQTTWSKSLSDVSSGLTQVQIDQLTVTSPQFCQRHGTLYITGGYGVITSSGLFDTKTTLSAIDIEGLIHWVVDPSSGETAAEHIRQINDPVFQATGGFMANPHSNDFLLIFGQNFTGFYTDSGNGDYLQQVRRFTIHDNGEELSVSVKTPKPELPNPNYRRRDLNVAPIIWPYLGLPIPSYVAFSGVFTVAGGAWTIPVMITPQGDTSMKSPSNKSAFKQGMNNYVCATAGLYSSHHDSMYEIFFGGISYGYFESGVFTTDPELPFINQITTIKLNKHNRFTQHIMNAQYPTILSTGSNPGNPLLFGAGAQFVPLDGLAAYHNGVIAFDDLTKKTTLIGYIVGGIQSTLPNTNTMSDSAASSYIFKVYIRKKHEH